MLRSYIKKFRKQSVITQDWIDHLNECFSDKKDVLAKVDFNGWMHTSGVPPNKPVYVWEFKED
jgi:leukotriene-A4 hydrolase